MVSPHPMITTETADEIKAAGAAAGDKAGKQMVAQCCPPGQVDVQAFAAGLKKAMAEAVVKMKDAGTTDESLKLWAEAFDAAQKPYIDVVAKTLNIRIDLA